MKTFSPTYLPAIAALALASCGCSKPAANSSQSAEPKAIEAPAFSADSAFNFLARQVNFGPRIPNSDAHANCAKWLASELRRLGADSVIEQNAILPDFGPMTNILGRFNSQAPKRIILLAHWDSRPWADNDPNPENHTKPIDGANDGASGVAVLLETARHLGNKSPEIGVDILLLDAEDSGSEGDDTSWARGAQFWAENMPYSPDSLPAFGVLLDMVGGRDAVFPREMFSHYRCREQTNRIWSLAAANGLASRFPATIGGAINDDHIPLINAGIPTIDIIESANPQTGSFNPTWHTLDDNIDNIDKNTLGDVGRLITLIIYNEKCP